MIRLSFLLLLTIHSYAQEALTPLFFDTEISYQLEQNDQLNFQYSGVEKRLASLPSYVETIKIDQLQEAHRPFKYLSESILARLYAEQMRAYALDSKQSLNPKEISLAHLFRDSVTQYGFDSSEVIGWQIMTSDRSDQINRLKIKQVWEKSSIR